MEQNHSPKVNHERLRKGLDQVEMRRKREATTVQIRKDKKEDSLQKRRRDTGGGSSFVETPRGRDGQVGALPDPALRVKLDSLPGDVDLLQSENPAHQLEATMRFRKLLSIERNPPIAEVIAAGAVPRLVQYCQCYGNPPLLFEAAWTCGAWSSRTQVPLLNLTPHLTAAQPNQHFIWHLGTHASGYRQWRHPDICQSCAMPSR